MEHKKTCSVFFDNTTILIYQFLCTIIIPIIILSRNGDYMHYYSFVLVCFSTILTYAGHRDIFSNLYTDNCTTKESYISTGLINIVAFIGILFSTGHYMKINNNLFDVVLYGLVLFTFTFVITKPILLYVLKQIDSYYKNKRLVKSGENWHKLLSGLIYLIIFLIFYILIINSFKTGIISKSLNKLNTKKSNNNKPNNNKVIETKNSGNITNITPVNINKNTSKNNNNSKKQNNIPVIEPKPENNVKNNSKNKSKNNSKVENEVKMTPKNLVNQATINNKKNILVKSKAKK